MPAITVTATRLDEARSSIQPSLGATTYGFTPRTIDSVPLGENAPLNQVLLRAPGVVQDSFGQIHVRGDMGNVQYRLDGVQLPEGLSLFNNVLATRYAGRMSLLTGALPAQYGLQTAGVVDITLKSGSTNPGADLSITGGSRDYAQPAFSYGGRSGKFDYFLSGQFIHSGLGIDNPTASFNPLHDDTDQWYGLAKITGIMDDRTRLSLIGGAARSSFQIPNIPFKAANFTVFGNNDWNSGILDQRQWEQTYFSIASLQKSYDKLDFQLSGFARYSKLSYQPDAIGDLLYNGIAPWTMRTTFAAGVQGDGSWKAAKAHTLRGGFLVQRERATTSTNGNALPLVPSDPDDPTSDSGPLRPAHRLHQRLRSYWLDLQCLPARRMAGGAHPDRKFRPAFRCHQRRHTGEPAKPAHQRRVGAQPDVYGACRLFALLHPTAARTGGELQFDRRLGRHCCGARSHPERSCKGRAFPLFRRWRHSQPVPWPDTRASALTTGSFKTCSTLASSARPLRSLRSTIATASSKALEFNASYDESPWSVYFNGAFGNGIGKNINSAQFSFGAAELAYIANNYIILDHTQGWTFSTGAAYTFNANSEWATKVSTDILFGSGLRTTVVTPNDASLPNYAVVNASLVQKIPIGLGKGTQLRFDVINLFDNQYQIRDGLGVGVGASQFGNARHSC